ncbi:transposase [Dactylosporangium sucinum]|uniref:transposase n=1 Tax=Dactylosporangium sucinum TaxID=1424081 RepID=UPI0035E9E74A
MSDLACGCGVRAADAVLCADGPVRLLAELSLVAEHRRGHGSADVAVVDGRIDVEWLRTALAGVSLPRAADGRLVLAVDITCWLRPEAQTSPERILCHTRSRGSRGKGQATMIPGWPYSMIAALESGRSSWTAPWTSSAWPRVTMPPAYVTISIDTARVAGCFGRGGVPFGPD